MMTVLTCITASHDLWLVGLAALISLLGSLATIQLFHRAVAAEGGQRMGWHFLASVTAGSSIWCTHFIAILGYQTGFAATFDPVLTIVSLVIAVLGSTVGFVLAASGLTRLAPAMGGAMVGLAIAAMHYTGMLGYRINGLITWDPPYIAASIAIAALGGALALHLGMRRPARGHWLAATAALVAAIIGLHFTGMAGVRIAPLVFSYTPDVTGTQSMAIAIAAVGFIILGASLTAYLIDSRVRMESVEKLQHMALHDILTGLPNRVSFNEALDYRIATARKLGGQMAVIGIDLDRFKEINDLKGHKTGDEILRIVAARLTRLSRDVFVARIDGDEFAVVKPFDDRAQLTEFIAQLERELLAPVTVHGSTLHLSVSIGIVLYPFDAEQRDALINNTDLAMHRAKADKARSTCFYDAAMDEQVRARRSLAEDLRHAIANDQLDVHYQVQTSVSTGTVRGYEALLRWTHPVHGAISPADFIPIAEENGLILTLGEWVLRQACTKGAALLDEYKIAVNLSPIQLAHADLPRRLHEILIETGLPPHRLELELTESTILKDRDRALHILRQIRALGVSIALDDFGTGYSSLETLRIFPFDKIKLDRSFIVEVETCPQAKAIIRAVLALGKSLDIPILAEGIETPSQLAILKSEGCDEAQGYLLGRPAPLTADGRQEEAGLRTA